MNVAGIGPTAPEHVVGASKYELLHRHRRNPNDSENEHSVVTAMVLIVTLQC